jgi:hypothetical protein
MLIREPVVDKPKNPVRHSSYERECREALRPHLDAILDLAVKAGWDRNIASYSLMYLAAKTASPSEKSAA